MRHSCNSPCLLVANKHRILALDYDNKSIFPVVSNLSFAVDVDFHYNKGYIFWSNIVSIQRSNMDGTNIIVIHNETYCYGLAVEWDSLQLYWTDYYNKIIMVSDLNGNNKRIVFTSLSGPTDIVLDPYQGSLPGSVYRLNPSNGKVKSNVTIEGYWRDAYGLVAYDSSLQFPVITCPVPSPSSGTRAICSRNATCQFSCEDGYVGSGSQVRRCQRNGTWSGHNYSCQKITCPVLSPPTHGKRYGCPGNLPLYNGTVCRFTCNNGYVGSGSQVRRCQYDGIWSGQNFVCKTLKCPTLSLPRNGVLLGCNTNNTEMSYDTECRFFCKEGSEAIGTTIKRCAENGTWIGPDLVCPE
nr:P-selectin-like [Pocillopora verrucosa]